MALALDAYGAPGYEVRAYQTRTGALRDAARGDQADRLARSILLAWRGAHTWVMTGFRADADPTVFTNAKVTGAYILDPWYPADLDHLGPIRPARHVPGHVRDGAQLPRLAAARGPLSRPRRPVHHGRPDDARQPAG